MQKRANSHAKNRPYAIIAIFVWGIMLFVFGHISQSAAQADPDASQNVDQTVSKEDTINVSQEDAVKDLEVIKESSAASADKGSGDASADAGVKVIDEGSCTCQMGISSVKATGMSFELIIGIAGLWWLRRRRMK